MPGSYVSRPGGQINPQRALTGVRHLSEELIRSTVKDTPLDSITVLKLNFSELSGKKIKVIENLEKLKRLHTLNLANNVVERLERLDSLAKLKDLDVSYNRLTKIEGLERLSSLVSLNLEGNQIETLPLWFSKKLKALRNLKLANNNIIALQELRKLRGLPNLTFLTIAGNPVCDLPHYRHYIIFHLTSLDALDGKRITPQERAEADQRFNQEELDTLHAEVEEMRSKYDQLQETHNKSLHDLETSHMKDGKLLQVNKENERRIKDLQEELTAKEDLIYRKQAELSRANQKHYELEQELAFYKIDTKFTSLHKKPDTPSVIDDSESLMESPYIGKSQHAKDQPYWPQSQKHLRKIQKPKRHETPDSLDSELEVKQREIDVADRKLAELNDQLQFTEQRVLTAADYLTKLTDALNKTRRQPLEPDEREQLENKLDELQKTIDELENNREQLLDNLDKNAEDISEAEQHLDDIDRSLDASDLEDSEKEALVAEKEDKEAFLSKAKDMKDDLEQALTDLEQVLDQKKLEAEELEHQLVPSEDIDPDNANIANVAAEVKDILKSMKQGHHSDGEAKRLRERLAELERIVEERAQAQVNLEKSLREEQEVNEQLRKELDGSGEGPTKAELEDDVRDLLAEKEKLEEQLSRQRSSSAHEDPHLKKELNKLKRENDKLKQQAELNKSLADAEMLAKLDDMVQGMESGRAPALNVSSSDPVGRKLLALQKNLEKQKKQAEKEARKLMDENQRLNDRMSRIERANESTDSESAALVEALKHELQDLRRNLIGENNLKQQLAAINDKLKKTQSELERARLSAGSPGRSSRLAKPPHFDLDNGLDDSYDESESTRDTVRRNPHRPSSKTGGANRGLYGSDERDRGGNSRQGSNSQNSGRATDENPRLMAPAKQNTARLPPHPDDVMSINSEVPVPYGQPRYPDRDNSPTLYGGGRGARPSDRKWSPTGLGTVPETYESDMEHPRHNAPAPNPETKRLKQQLQNAGHEINRLEKLLAERDRDLDDTMRQSDQANEVITQQKNELDNMRDQLNRYKEELDRLAGKLASHGALSPDDIHRLNSLQQAVSQTNPQSQQPIPQQPMMSHSQPQQPIISQPHPQQPMMSQLYPQQPITSQPYAQPTLAEQAQMSASFIQGPTFRPGDQPALVQGSGQMFTSTPHRHLNQSVGTGTLYQPQQQFGSAPLPLSQPGYQVTYTNPVAASSCVSGQPLIADAGTVTCTLTGPATVSYVNPNSSVVVTHPVSSVSPIKTVILNASASAATTTTPRKSILKTVDRNHLVCNIPEHHDLEDEIARLREKCRALKEALKQAKDKRQEETKVASQAKAAMQLKHALKERRTELESLDLAINMQKEQLHLLKNSIKSSRTRTGSTRDGRRGESGNTAEELDQLEAEDYLKSEIECLEGTLAKRRAELKEADSRLRDCRSDLETVKEEAELMITRYDAIKDQLESAEEQLQLLADRKDERQDEVADLMVKVKRLTEQRDELQGQITQIDDVTKDKDTYFNSLNERIQQSEQVLQHLQESIRKQTADAEQQLHEIRMEAERHLMSVKQSESELTSHYTDIKDIKSVLAERSGQLSSVNTEIGETKQQLSHLTSQINEEKATLHGLQAEAKVVNEEIKDRRSELSSMSQIEREMKDRLESRKDILNKLKDRIEDEKETLQGLTISVEQKEDQLAVLKKSLGAARAESAELLREISERKCLLESLNAEYNVIERDLSEMRMKHTEGKQLLDRMQSESISVGTMLDKLKSEQNCLATSLSQKTLELESITRQLEANKARIQETNRNHSQLETDINSKATELERLQMKIKQTQDHLEDLKASKVSSESDLENITSSLKDQKSTASRLKKAMKEMENKRTTLTSECERLLSKKQETEQQLQQLRSEQSQLSNRLVDSKTSMSEQQKSAAEIKEDLNRLEHERTERQRCLRELASQYEKDSQQLTDMTERAERELSHMRDQQEICQTRVNELTRELSRLMNEITKNKKEHGDLTQLRIKLQNTEHELETERSTNGDLMKRLTEFTSRLQSRNESLIQIKRQSDEHIKSLNDELHQVRQECREVKLKCDNEIEDLEALAQQHAQRAERLNADLMTAREQVQILKSTIHQLEEASNGEKKLTETLTNLKQDIQQEVTQGIAELEKSRADTMMELDELKAQKAYITNEVISLKENLDKVHKRHLDCQRPSQSRHAASPKKLASSTSAAAHVRMRINAEQELIRQRMHEQMQRHLEAMEGMKTHSMSILNGLQDRVSSLQGVLSESSTSLNTSSSPAPSTHQRSGSPQKYRAVKDT